MRPALTTLFLLVALAACSVGQPGDTAAGEEIYQQLCANCHGEDLKGGLGPELGPGSNSAAQPDEFLELAILRGRGLSNASGVASRLRTKTPLV